MKAAFGHGLFLLIATATAGCSGSPANQGAPPVAAASVASLSIALSGAPTFSTAQAAATYPIVLRAYRSDGSLINGKYAQQIVVVLVPQCQSGLGLQGGSAPIGAYYVPVTVGVCPPGENVPFTATAVTSSSTAIALTWNGTPIGTDAELYASGTNVPPVTLDL
jgi:hypothetical protein